MRIFTLSLALVLLLGIMFAVSAVEPRAFRGADLAVLIGFILLAANAAGGLAASFGLPRLTGYLVVGIVVGPSVLGLISESNTQDLRLIDEFALALIAMLAGGELRLKALRPRAKEIAYTTLAVVALVTVGMTAVVVALRPLLPFLAELPLGAAAGVGLLLGIWASNSSPDLTVAVIEETHAKGPYTDVLLGVTIVKDVVVIVLFTLALALVAPLVEADAHFSAHVFVELGQHVGGALVLGALAGWLFSLYLRSGPPDEPRPPLATFLFAYVIVVVADHLAVELLLMAVAAGFVIENYSPAGDRMIRGIEQTAVVVFAFFFVVAGASLDLGAIRQYWLAALLVFGARAGLTWAGARIGLARAGAEPFVKGRLWEGLLSQGGVTLGLILLLAQAYPSLGQGVVALGMAVIIGNILGGPVLLKRALGAMPRGGEGGGPASSGGGTHVDTAGAAPTLQPASDA